VPYSYQIINYNNDDDDDDDKYIGYSTRKIVILVMIILSHGWTQIYVSKVFACSLQTSDLCLLGSSIGTCNQSRIASSSFLCEFGEKCTEHRHVLFKFLSNFNESHGLDIKNGKNG